MIALRPVSHLIGLMLAALGAAMLIPALVDLAGGLPDWQAFAQAGIITGGTGILVVIATANAKGGAGLGLRESFLLTAAVWSVLPGFGALPYLLLPTPLSPVDAWFESISAMTTTGTTVITGLEHRSPGLLLWRSLEQWIGGLGIVVVALIFLPVMRVGGMQHFRAEGFDTMGKVLPRVRDISVMLLQIYAGLTALALLAYLATGMDGFEALNHALTTIATGGFATRDSSFAGYGAGVHYVAAGFMWASGLPFIRYIQLVNGDWRPMQRDVQIRAYLRWTLYAVALVVAWRLWQGERGFEEILRLSLFNTVSVMTGTGYSADDPSAWGDFPLLVLIVMGLIGACTASTGCSIKVFRFLVLFAAIRAQLQVLIHPHRVVPLRLGGQVVSSEVVGSVVVMFVAFLLGLGVLMIGLSLTGLSTRAAITAAWSAICNIGPVFGPEVNPLTGSVEGFGSAAKLLMTAGMLLGRLEMVAFLVLLLPRFWRA